MNPNAWPLFGEYNTHLANGTVLTPASNVVTFIDEKSGNATKDIETVINAEVAARYTMENILGTWATTAAEDATQAVCDLQKIEDNAVYLVEALNGNAEIMLGSKLKEEVFPEGSGITVRKANARGGFGPKAGDVPQGVEDVQENKVPCTKVIENGQILIKKNGKIYNVLGTEVR